MSIYPESQLGIWLNTPIKFLETTAGRNLRAARNDALWRNAANDCQYSDESSAEGNDGNRTDQQPCLHPDESEVSRQYLSARQPSGVPALARGSVVGWDNTTGGTLIHSESLGTPRLLDPAKQAMHLSASVIWRCLRNFAQKPLYTPTGSRTRPWNRWR